ncbi:hypothetical protein LWX53_06615 [bacterium]|nr:hypothetical protein [bacterium]
MKLFSIALVPEGNIVAQVRTVRAAAFKAGDGAGSSALPEGIYLGFYEAGAAAGGEAGEKALVRSFRRNAGALLEGLPPALAFSTLVRAGGKWYLNPEPPLSPALAEAADGLAGEAGFHRAPAAPLAPLAGFFASNDVTPPTFGAFSFRHLDAVLYRMECADDGNFDALWWRCLARAPRHVGPRRKTGGPPATGQAGPVVNKGGSVI